MPIAALQAAAALSAGYHSETASAIVKAASAGSNPYHASVSAMSGFGGEFGGINSNSVKHAEQYRYFRDWVYTSIVPVAKRMMNQEFFVASLSSTAQLRATKELDLKASNPVAFKRWSDKLFKTKLTLPQCFKSLGERLEPMDDHPILETLQRPNDVLVGCQLIYLLGVTLKITGEHVWLLDDFKKDEKTGETRWQIWPIPSHWATPVHTKEKLFARWNIRPPGMAEAIPIDGKYICYFYMPNPEDPLSSLSPVMAQAKAIATDEQIQSSQFHMMRDGIRPDMLLTVGTLPGMEGKGEVTPILTPEQRAQIIEAVKLVYRGVTQRGEPLILDGMIKSATPYTRTPEEMGYLDSGKITKNRIFLGAGVNSISAGEVEGVNRASSAVADEHLCKNEVNPLDAVSQIISLRVAPLFEKNGEKLICWMDPAQGDDPEMKVRRVQVGQKAMTPNELRKMLLNLPPIEDEYADVPFYKIPPAIAAQLQQGIAGQAGGSRPPKKPGAKPAANRNKPAGGGRRQPNAAGDGNGAPNRQSPSSSRRKPSRKPAAASANSPS